MRPMGTAAYGGKGQVKGKGRGEGRLGQGGRGRSKGGEKPMGTTAYGGKGSKGRAANGDRPVGAASCRRDHHTMASRQNPPRARRRGGVPFHTPPLVLQMRCPGRRIAARKLCCAHGCRHGVSSVPRGGVAPEKRRVPLVTSARFPRGGWTGRPGSAPAPPPKIDFSLAASWGRVSDVVRSSGAGRGLCGTASATRSQRTAIRLLCLAALRGFDGRFWRKGAVGGPRVWAFWRVPAKAAPCARGFGGRTPNGRAPNARRKTRHSCPSAWTCVACRRRLYAGLQGD